MIHFTCLTYDFYDFPLSMLLKCLGKNMVHFYCLIYDSYDLTLLVLVNC